MAQRFDVMSARTKRDGGTHWHRVGTAWQGDKGINVVFDSLPLPDAEGRVSVSLFEPRERDGGNQQSRGGQSRGAGGGSQRSQAGRNYDNNLDDEVPF